MSIAWYPGHMHKARKELTKLMASVQLVIEVLDARLPMASSNPMLASLRQDRPCIKILNKTDLAIESVTDRWQAWFNREANVLCLRNGKHELVSTGQLLKAADKSSGTPEWYHHGPGNW